MTDLAESLPSPADDALQLPVDFHRTRGTTARWESHAFDLAVALPADATLRELIVAAFATLLFRYNGQASIPLDAAPPLRLETTAETTFRQVLAETKLGLERGGSPSGPSGGAAVSVAPENDEHTQLDALAFVASLPPARREAALHLVLRGARAAFVYDGSLFQRTSIERFAGHLRELLAGLAGRWDARLAELPMLPAAECAWLDAVCVGAGDALPAGPLHAAIARHAATMPDAIAVRFRDATMSYAELERRASQLAHHLVARGVGAEGRVIVCLEPSFEIVVTLLGILKAGGVYVPLDPGYPPGRIGAILDDTSPGLVVTQRHLVEKLGGRALPVLVLAEAEGELAALPSEAPPVAIDPLQTAYVYYTSGTTGKPKGVMASHHNLVAYIQVAQRRYEFTPRDVMPAIARFSFSISMFELMSPLVCGGTLVVLEREHILDLPRMARTLSEMTFFHMGPSLLRNVVTYIERHPGDGLDFAHVRHASSGGDMIPPDVLEALKRIFFNAEVFVIYGCSEISCMGCTYPVPRDRTVTKTYVGRPFATMEARVLDNALGLVPAGVVGEICFAGDGIVKGYLNRPELTAEKFIEVLGRRFYRTGDMGRLSDDGWLEILGRSDFQVKLRGMRVELGEVEYNLRRAPGVRDGVVMAKAGSTGEKALVAYVVADPSAPSDKATRLGAVRRHMADNVPDYMVPSVYVELGALPLNHNMKVDRFALPDPTAADLRGSVEKGLRLPETATEKVLADLWKKLLRLDDVGLDDNFFELGGYSMLAVELILEAEKSLGVVLDGMDVLRECLEVLATIVDRARGLAPAKAVSSSAALPVADPVETFHFGREGGLYGVLHGSTVAPSTDAVLVCLPVGSELVRAHFVLQRFARNLADLGIPAMLFDYFGCGDSAGASIDATPGRWQRDIAEAHDELRRRTRASRITAVGVRLGATLLANTRLPFSKLVLWDPVASGLELLAEQRAIHQKYLRSVQHLRLRWPLRHFGGGSEQLLGVRYSEAALRELEALSLPRRTDDTPVRWLVTSRPIRQKAAFEASAPPGPGTRLETLDFDCLWHDIALMEDVLPDVGIARALAAMVQEKP